MAGKEYTTAPILVNSDGHPIPQYLDITDTTDSPQGTFKPLTQLQAEHPDVQNVQLTGSMVELFESDTDVNIEVAPGESFTLLSRSKRYDIKKVIVLFASAEFGDTWEVRVHYYVDNIEVLNARDTKNIGRDDKVVFDDLSHNFSIRIRNTRDVPQTVRRFNITGIR